MDHTDAATIAAAHIGADAAIRVAWMQIVAACIAAAGAIAAGVVAYRGAIKAATRQVLLQEETNRAQLEAYQFRLSLIVDEALEDARLNKQNADHQLARHNAGIEDELLTPMMFDVPAELTPQYWREHATLGIEAVRGIHLAYEALTEASRFSVEMLGKMYSGQSSRPTVARVANQPDGSAIVSFDPAVQQYAKTAEALVSALKELETILQSR